MFGSNRRIYVKEFSPLRNFAIVDFGIHNFSTIWRCEVLDGSVFYFDQSRHSFNRGKILPRHNEPLKLMVRPIGICRKCWKENHTCCLLSTRCHNSTTMKTLTSSLKAFMTFEIHYLVMYVRRKRIWTTKHNLVFIYTVLNFYNIKVVCFNRIECPHFLNIMFTRLFFSHWMKFAVYNLSVSLTVA